ncbi:divalent-cation tolerance protein CutA [Amphiplicatus metriothermophilus]|uniref:Divalent cation tolerance protein n=1 Tax=Amphiplicatus metriothermophilus TaxID=1519374 RepID=A0A239PPQ2_9PROT|nr:divalent-cation tolerance protein CutA [Amphiplicatus metriothermophilus]MBB5518725.1 periplasmic divalent cation tolerance protein [Amphiplicatus metriothermophilus]SNT72118.1 divalent cation tolerance protein [Amphiplicatus metriothermophilus]
MTSIIFLYATAPDFETARKIAAALVEKKFAACVNILGGSTSIYRWRGAVETAEEITFIVKTHEGAASSARDLILRLHPYETPCVAALRVDPGASNAAFLDWIRAESGGAPGP